MLRQSYAKGPGSPRGAGERFEIVLELAARVHDGVAPADESVGRLLPGRAAIEQHPRVPHRVHPLRKAPRDGARRTEIAQVLEEPRAGGLVLVPALLDPPVGEDVARPAGGIVL